jgi:NADP-dependent 3-hydroxy acid dehydrogenase YdfG
MNDFVRDKVMVVTGAAGGFGRLVSLKAAARGARLVCADVDAAGVAETEAKIASAGGTACAMAVDVRDLAAMKALAANAVARFGAIDVIVNNAGTMPLAFYADHGRASEAWDRCIDINFKGVLHGIIAVYDQMTAQGRGHIINISSIYGNFPVTGAAVYGATKAAVNFLSDSLRVETQGRIKVTTIRPTGVPATGLRSGIVNMDAVAGILGQNLGTYRAATMAMAEGKAQPGQTDPNDPRYLSLSPKYIADAVIAAIDQPWGVSISDVTVRATGDGYIL